MVIFLLAELLDQYLLSPEGASLSSKDSLKARRAGKGALDDWNYLFKGE